MADNTVRCTVFAEIHIQIRDPGDRFCKVSLQVIQILSLIHISFATLMFYVLYLVGFQLGANGYLLAIISGDLVSVLFLGRTGKLWNDVELKGLNKNLWQQMLRFSLPMSPAQISFWVINASDLFFVREMCDGIDGHSGEMCIRDRR